MLRFDLDFGIIPTIQQTFTVIVTCTIWSLSHHLMIYLRPD